jgi:single-strand DNA-binding protein
MAGVNRVLLIGNLGKDPEVITFENGVKKASFPLATSESYKNKEGNRVDQTEWHNIVMWRGLAEVAEKYIHKGDQIFIEGKIRTRSYEVDGVKKYITEIFTDNMTMLGKRGDSQGTASQQPTETSQAPKTEDTETIVPEDGDLPF